MGVGLSGRRTFGLSDYRAVGLLGRRNIRLEPVYLAILEKVWFIA